MTGTSSIHTIIGELKNIVPRSHVLLKLAPDQILVFYWITNSSPLFFVLTGFFKGISAIGVDDYFRLWNLS